MYDPMVAKLIVWDVDREAATQRMLRALDEYEIEGLKTLIPFHSALLADRAVGQRRDLPRPLEDKDWLKTLAFPKAGEAADRRRRRAAETVEQTYTVEVSGRRFDVNVIGPAFGGAVGGERRRAGGGAEAPSAASASRGGGGGGPDLLDVAAAGQHVEGRRRAGPDRRGGPARSASSRR